MFGRSGAGLDGHGAQRRGAALGEHDAVDAGAVGHAQQRAEVLRIFDAVESQHQARRAPGDWRRGREQVFDGQKLLRTDEGHDALMRGGSGKLRQLLARIPGGRGRRPRGTRRPGVPGGRHARSRATSTWSKRRRPALRASSTGCRPYKTSMNPSVEDPRPHSGW